MWRPYPPPLPFPGAAPTRLMSVMLEGEGKSASLDREG